MEISQLRYFVQVCREGSFSKAAAALGVTQPMLSRQIRALEADLGVSLLYRHGRGAAVTGEGTKVRALAENVLGTIARMRDEAVQDKGVPRGTVSLALPPFLAAVLARSLIGDMRNSFPELQIHLIDGFSGHVHEWLIEGRVDLAVLNEARRSRTTNVEHLLSVDLFLTGPAKSRGPHPDVLARGRNNIELNRISGLPLLVPDRSHGIRRVIEQQMARAGADLNVALTVDSLSALKELIADGAGYGILPFGSIRPEYLEGKFQAARIIHPEVKQNCVLATSGERPITLAMREVVDYLRRNAERIHEEQLPAQWRSRPGRASAK
jgi:LysR family nitrogen assimilation transcriptional regulator